MIWATGYEAVSCQSYFQFTVANGCQDTFALDIKGKKETVKEYYTRSAGPKAHLGVSVPGFPNFFMLGGR